MTLLPIINPLSSAPVFAATVGANRAIAQRLARQVAINAWFVLVVSMLIGTYVLALFGISLPVVRIGGGLLVAATAWHMLHHTEDDDVHAVAAENAARCRTPRSCSAASFRSPFRSPPGPARSPPPLPSAPRFPPGPVLYALGVLVAARGAALVSLALYLIFKNSVAVLDRLGEIGTLVMIRMMAFILLCIGIQIMWTGWAELNGIAF